MKKKIFFIIIFIYIILYPILSMAATTVELKMDTNIDKEFTVDVYVSGDKISAADLEIYFDNDKLEYISGSENSNFLNGRIIFSWYDNEGNGKSDYTLGRFTFNQKHNANTIILIKGKCYNQLGTLVETIFKDIQISQIEQIVENKEESGTSTDESNAYLKIMRTNQEDIVPIFNKDIKEYYLTTDKEINNLDITAIPENSKSKIEIIGNNNLKFGKNIVEIKVTSPDEKNVNNYIINITKTNNLKNANTNLENLAVENNIIYPNFDSTVTEYKMEINPDTEKLNLLAIPENENATVTVQGNRDLKIGDNIILINVLAEDGITTRNYKIVAHKRNNEEQKIYEQQEKEETEKLEILLNEENQDIENTNQIEDALNKNNITKKNIILSILLFLIVANIIVIALKNNTQNK